MSRFSQNTEQWRNTNREIQLDAACRTFYKSENELIKEDSCTQEDIWLLDAIESG